MADRRWLWPAAPLAALAGCDSPPADVVPQAAAIIPCALDGASGFAEECIAELIEADAARQIVVRHPDGELRRFTLLDGGRGLVPAEGGGAAAIAVGDSGIDVSIEDDRYRFPATISLNGAQ